MFDLMQYNILDDGRPTKYNGILHIKRVPEA